MRRVQISPEEQLRESRLRFERDRRAYRQTRVLIRTVLSGYCDVGPSALQFETSPAGKPKIAFPAGTGLDFSLSHTEGIAVLLVGRDRAVGVDVEGERRLRASELPLHLLGPAEIERLQSLSPARRAVRFLEHWTLKEAYAKARGSGLELPLEDWEFTIGEDGAGACLAPHLESSSEPWWFALAPAARGFVTAIAASLHSAGEAAPAVEVFAATSAGS